MKKVKRLFTGFQPQHYELFLEPDRESASFSGRVVISGRKIGRPSQRITLHQKGLKIKSAKLTKHDKEADVEFLVDRINTHKSFDELRLHSKDQLYPGNYTIELQFSGKITEPMHGIYPCNFVIDNQKKQLIATQFESHHAREAFPCIDEPEAKATYSLKLATPLNETVIANTPVKNQEESKSKLVTEFEKTPIMSSYLLAFAYGELNFKEAKAKSGVKVRVYTTPDKVGLVDFALDTAVRCLDFFEEYYGVPYPLPKQDLIALPDFSAAAMENWGLITFRESYLLVDPASTGIETKQFVAMVIAHELAHMWFGDLVTMKWWNDLWLNESFANLMEYRAVVELFPEWNFWQNFIQREISAAISRDSLPNVQPVQVEVRHPDELSSVFDPSIVYAKGGSLLHMVMHLVGESNFRKGLKSYFEEFQYSNTTADDLWKHLEKASGIKIQAMMQNWLQKPGYPVLLTDYNLAKKTLDITQKRLIVGGSSKADSTVWQVPLAASSKLEKPIMESAELSQKLDDDKYYPLTLNHNGQSYFVAQYLNKNHFSQLLAAIEKQILSPIDRLLLVQNYLLLEKAAQVSTLENVQLLPAYKNEREEAVWGMLAGILGNARSLINKDNKLEQKLNSFVRPIIKPLVKELGWVGAKNDSAQIQKLRELALSMAAGAEDTEVIKEGLGLYKKFKKPADLAPDIRSVVYFIGVRHGSKMDFERLVNMYNELNSADEKEEVASELTSTRVESQIKELLSLMKTGVRPQDFSHWFAWLMRNRYSTDLTWQWLNDNWQWIEEKFSSDKSYDFIPRYSAMAFSYPAQLKMYKAFFEPKTNTALERAIKLGVEEIEGRIAWRQKNEQAVKDWLTKLAQ